jgi:outer membrane lipoprotein-sorting protein
MRIGRLCGLLVFLSSPAIAQQTVIKDPTAITIAQRALIAMGGSATFQNVQASGTTTLYGDSGSVTYPITLMATGTASVRTSITKPSGVRVYVTDGFTTCVDSAPANATADSRVDQYARRIDFVPALTILREYSVSNIQVQYAGTDTVGGSPVDVIALSFMPPNIPLGFDGYQATQRLFYIDQSSSLLLKMRFMTVIDASSGLGPKTEVYFSQYEVLGGFAVPMYQATYADGQLAQELVLTSATFNPGLDSSLFSTNCAVTNVQ